MKKRIEYLDAMRGFTMFLVVYNHVLICSFEGGAFWSVNDIFLTFRMPLFFFLSGFLMYKKNRFRESESLSGFLRQKGTVQLIPTLVFSIVYALILSVPYPSLLLDKAKCGYWFTYTLFFYFLIYATGDYLIGEKVTGKPKIWIGGIVVCLIYAFSKFSLSPSCPWFNSPVNGILGFANYQYFLFFFSGALARAYFPKIEALMDKENYVISIVVGFFLLQFLLQLPSCKTWIISTGSYSAYSLLRTFSGFFGIALILTFFRKNETAILQSRVGKFFQYIGIRTLDIYLLHLILIHTNMHFIGGFLEKNSSFISELAVGGGVSIIIIGLCLIISRFIRCSDVLARLLFGKVIKE